MLFTVYKSKFPLKTSLHSLFIVPFVINKFSENSTNYCCFTQQNSIVFNKLRRMSSLLSTPYASHQQLQPISFSSGKRTHRDAVAAELLGKDTKRNNNTHHPRVKELRELDLREHQFSLMKINEFGLVHMSVKVPFPDEALQDEGKCQNLVGRILGPRGISVRQLEMLYGCKILIRGRGSIKDPEKEKRLRGKPDGRHLEEQLHVLVEAQDMTMGLCVRKLMIADQCIEKLMAPVAFDEYKRQQLVLLAKLNGTYRPPPSHRNSDNNKLIAVANTSNFFSYRNKKSRASG